MNSLRVLQQKFPDNLWIASPEFYYDVPDNKRIAEVLNLSYTALNDAGFNFQPQTPFFFGAHGGGSKVLQDYLFTNETYKHLPVNLTGLILTGAVFNRYYRAQVGKHFVPVFTLAGELDGYNRLTRVTESLYFDSYMRSTPTNSYTVVIEGMNNYQFVGDGNPPDILMFEDDIKPEISNDTATNISTTFLKSFLKVALCSFYTDCSDEKDFIESAVTNTINLVKPILDAFQIEGYYYLQDPPCFIIPELNPPNCTQGSKWVGHIQQVFGTFDIVPNISNTDTFMPFNDFLLKRPKLHNTCEMVPCQLNISTFTQTDYRVTYPQQVDDSLSIVGPVELRAQMISRQAIVHALTGKVLNFNETDGGDRCAFLNNYTIDWAMQQAPNKTLERYKNKGMQLVTGPDIDSLGIAIVWMYNEMVKALNNFSITILK